VTRTMYDGVDATRLPTSAQLVAGYVDGLYRWSDANWARFPHSVKVRVAVFSQTNDGQVLDVEPGNATPAQSVDWVLMRRRAGVDPTVYMNTSTWPTVRAAFRARGVAEPHYWVAQYDDVASIPSGAIAKQYYNNNDLGYDLSVVADHWPGVDPAPFGPTPTPTPAAAPIRRNDMHVDLKPNTPVVFTNPAAVLGDTSYLLLASDFGDGTVRVARFSLKAGGWQVENYTVAHNSGAIKIAMTGDINKVSVELTAATGTVGMDVLA
jgi:hypothetical protein